MGKLFNMNKSGRKNIITIAAVTITLIILNYMVSSGNVSNSFRELIPTICCYIILAISLNLVVGILGELSLGHAAFMFVGALSSGVFSKIYAQTIVNDYLRFFIAVLVGTAMGAIFGAFIGSAVLRLRGDYLAVVTLAFGEVIRSVVNNLYMTWDNNKLHVSFLKDKITDKLSDEGIILVKGAEGLTSGKGRLSSVYKEFVRNNTYVLLGTILVIIALILVLNFINSRSGRAVMAIRDNRIAAEATGINITKYRLIIYSFSSALAGMAGALYVHFLGSCEPKKFDFNFSIEILVIVVLGGIGSIRGSIIAAFILTWLPKSQFFMGLDKYRMLIYSIVLIIMMIFNWNPKCKELLRKLSPKRLFKKKEVM